MNPHEALRRHVSGAVERGEAEPIVAVESWLADAQGVVTHHQHIEVASGVLLDATSANMLLTVHAALSPANQAKFEAMDLLTAVQVGWKLVKV
jgi:hypothetical protein